MPDLYFLIEFPIFREFDGDDIEALAGLCEVSPFNAGAAVVREGEPADAMYIVQTGVLEVCRKVEGTIKNINLLSAGEFFGEMALIDGSPRSADVICKEDAILVRLSSEAFQSLRKGHPATALKIADVLLKTLSFRVRRSTSRALSNENSASTSQVSTSAAAKKPRRKTGKSKSSKRKKNIQRAKKKPKK